MVMIKDPHIQNLKEEHGTNTVYHDPTVRQNKSMKIQLRLTPAIEQQLRQYAETKGTTVTDAAERIVNEKFHNKKVNRDYFNLEKQAHLLVPRDYKMLPDYEQQEINMVANIVETSNEVYNIALFDQHEDLFTNNPEDYAVVTIQQVNNGYDIYDEFNDCYYSNYNIPEGETKYLNHTGLIVIIHEDPFDNQEDYSSNKIRLAIFTHVYDGELIEARLISFENAVKLAEDVDNYVLKDYLMNTEETIKLEKIHDMIETNRNITYFNEELKKENEELRKELSNHELDEDLYEKLESLQQENLELKKKLQDIDSMVGQKIKEAFQYASEKIRDTSDNKEQSNAYYNEG